MNILGLISQLIGIKTLRLTDRNGPREGVSPDIDRNGPRKGVRPKSC